MRDFSWKYFTLTGDVESFMLYKEMDQYGTPGHPESIQDFGEENATMDDNQ